MKEKGKVPSNWNTRPDKHDKLHPVHTVCFYHGTDKWDGPRSLKDMMDFEGAPPGWEEKFHDYKMSLFCAGEVEDLSQFRTGLRQFLEVIPLRKNRKKLIELWSREDYRHLDRDTAEMIAIITDSATLLERLDEYEGEGEYDMCQAMDEWKEELLAEGTERGIERGIEQGVLLALGNIMQTMKLTMEQAMEALLIPEEERERYKQYIDKRSPIL